MSTIAQTLKILMKERKLTMQQLSDKSGITFASIKSIRQGRSKNPRSDTMSALAKALGCTIDELESGPDQNKRSDNTQNNVELFKNSAVMIDKISLKSGLELDNDIRSKCINQLYNFALEAAHEIGQQAKIDEAFAQWLVYNLPFKSNESSQEIEYNINRTIALVTNQLTQYANAIAMIDTGNFDAIYKILSTDNNKLADIPYSSFDWVTTEGKAVVSTTLGILDDPFDASFRPILKKTQDQPGIVHIDEITIGVFSGKLIVLVGIGVIDKNENLLGTLITGVDISRLNNIIKRPLHNSSNFL